MKKYILMGVLCFAMGLLSTSQSADTAELDEAMTKQQYHSYRGLADDAHAALKAKNFLVAYDTFIEAGKASHFGWVRARMFANAGFAMARAQHCTESLTWYNEAMRVQEKAEAVASGGPKWAKARKQTRRDINWGLKVSSCAPKGK